MFGVVFEGVKIYCGFQSRTVGVPDFWEKKRWEGFKKFVFGFVRFETVGPVWDTKWCKIF